MGFPLVPKSVTLNDRKQLNDRGGGADRRSLYCGLVRYWLSFLLYLTVRYVLRVAHFEEYLI